MSFSAFCWAQQPIFSNTVFPLSADYSFSCRTCSSRLAGAVKAFFSQTFSTVRGDLGAIWRASSAELAFWTAYFSKTRISLTPWIVSVLRDYFCKTVLDRYRQKVKRPGVGQAKVNSESASSTDVRQRIIVLRTGIRTAKGKSEELARSLCFR